MKYLLLTLSLLLAQASHALAQGAPAGAPAASAPYNNPIPGEFHTGVLEEEGGTFRLRYPDGTRVDLYHESSSDFVDAASDLASTISAFVGKTITVRGLRYRLAAGSRAAPVLAVQTFAPGKSKDFISGRLAKDEHGIYLRAPGGAHVYLKGALGERLEPHAQTLPTTIGMGDGVIVYGETVEAADGTLFLARSKPDVWYLTRAWSTRRRLTKDPSGLSYRLLGLQTPATSSADPATSKMAYGHLEVPADIDLKGNQLGSTRTMVRGRMPSKTKPLRFKPSHPSIRVIGSEFGAPINNNVSTYLSPEMVRIKPRAARKPRSQGSRAR